MGTGLRVPRISEGAKAGRPMPAAILVSKCPPSSLEFPFRLDGRPEQYT